MLAATLAVHLEAQGTRVDPALWEKRNVGYRRLDRIRTTVAEIERVIPVENKLILVDDGDWSQGHLEGRELMPDRTHAATLRRRRPGRAAGGECSACGGQAPRASRRVAHRLRLARAAWWLQHYPRFDAYLKSRGRPLTGGLLGYDLTAAVDAPEGPEPLVRLARDADLPARRAQLAAMDRRVEELRRSLDFLEDTIAQRTDREHAIVVGESAEASKRDP